MIQHDLSNGELHAFILFICYAMCEGDAHVLSGKVIKQIHLHLHGDHNFLGQYIYIIIISFLCPLLSAPLQSVLFFCDIATSNLETQLGYWWQPALHFNFWLLILPQKQLCGYCVMADCSCRVWSNVLQLLLHKQKWCKARCLHQQTCLKDSRVEFIQLFTSYWIYYYGHHQHIDHHLLKYGVSKNSHRNAVLVI